MYTTNDSGQTWTQNVKLLASDGEANDNFGVAVAIHNYTIVVGAYQDDDKANNAGASLQKCYYGIYCRFQLFNWMNLF